MNAKQLSEQIEGMEYPPRFEKRITDIAKMARLVIVYGASDDLLEFEGAIQDEVGCYGGCVALVDGQGLIPSRDNIDNQDDEVMHNWLHRKATARKVEAIWGEGGISWRIKTDIPHHIFNIREDGEIFCQGIVFSLNDL
jgi:hypothetical protein